MVCGSEIHPPRFPRLFGSVPADGHAAAHMRQVRTHLSGSTGASDVMAKDTGAVHENLLPTKLCSIGRLDSGLKLRLHPFVELILRFSHYPQGHMGMLQPAEFR